MDITMTYMFIGICIGATGCAAIIYLVTRPKNKLFDLSNSSHGGCCEALNSEHLRGWNQGYRACEDLSIKRAKENEYDMKKFMEDILQ